MDSMVASNRCVATVQNLMIDELNDTTQYLRVFSNNFTPDPGTGFGAFTEATFTGYAAAHLIGHWGAEYKVVNGLYQSDSDTFTFTCTAGTQIVYGWYISDGTDWWMAKNFPAPITMVAGASFTITLQPNTVAQSIL